MPDPATLAEENAKLLAQAEAMSGDRHVLREAEPWRDAGPAERLAATWALCRQVEWLRALWPEEVAERAGRREPAPADMLDLLRRLRLQGGA